MPTMDYNVLIHKKLSGQITDSEQIELDNWLNRDTENQRAFDEIKLIWDGADEDDEEITTEHFQQGLMALENAVTESIIRQKQIRRYQRNGWVKNIIIGVLLTSSAYLIAARYKVPEVNRPVRIVRNENNEIILSDSSQIVLNSQSSILFSETSGQRKIDIIGEAFFTISKDPRPLVVQAPGITVTVFETSFLLKAYPDKPMEVLVISGKAKVSVREREVLITAGEKAVLDLKGNILSKVINDDPNFNAWHTRKLQFNKTELRRILELIEELYHISFTINDKEILGCRFTGSFDHAKLEHVLKTLSFSMDIKFTSDIGSLHQVSGKSCVQ